MLIHGRIAHTEANGPGVRCIVHLQGCTLGCAGCWNPESHAFGESAEMSIWEMAKWILEQDVEGVTFSGGEPFQQAPALELLIAFIKARKPGFSFGAFTGYTVKELKEGRYQWYNPGPKAMVPGDSKLANAILNQMDFIIAGRYNDAKRVMDKPLCGSSNQEVVFLSKRYSAKDLPKENFVEVTIDKDQGLVQITGFPDDVKHMDQGLAGSGESDLVPV